MAKNRRLQQRESRYRREDAMMREAALMAANQARAWDWAAEQTAAARPRDRERMAGLTAALAAEAIGTVAGCRQMAGRYGLGEGVRRRQREAVAV